MNLATPFIRAVAGRNSLSARLAEPDILRDGLAPSAQRRLFSAVVRLVEVEPHAACTRACWFCLNAATGARQGTMAEDLHTRVLCQLAEIGYVGMLQYARYCEPLADQRLARLLRTARHRLPQASLKVISNGDLLTRSLLGGLADAGLDILAISLYLPAGTAWSPAAARERIQSFADRLGLPCRFRRPYPAGIFADLAHPGLRLDARCLDFGPGREGFDRGGAVAALGDPGFIREAPCPFVFRSLALDWNGNAMPCCNLHSDHAPHRQYALGNVGTQDVFAIFASPAAVAWRRRLAVHSPKDGPCRHCRDARIAAWRDRLAAAILARPRRARATPTAAALGRG